MTNDCFGWQVEFCFNGGDEAEDDGAEGFGVGGGEAAADDGGARLDAVDVEGGSGAFV